MNTNHTDITIVIDRSGSMGTVRESTIAGFNKFLLDQKRAPGTAALTLYQFDDIFETVYPARTISVVQPLTPETYVPRGNTALLDAIGRAITETGARLADIPEKGRPGKVVFVIITDGVENASRDFNRKQINDMIAHQRQKYSWEFVFLGANQDAIHEARSYGIAAANAMTYAANDAGTTSAFASTSDCLVRMRSGTKADMSYEKKHYDAQAAAGATNQPNTGTV